MWAEGKTWWDMPRSDFVIAPGISWNITKKTTLAVDYTYQLQKNTANWTFPVANADPGHIMIDGTLVKLNRRLYLGQEDDQRKVIRNVVYSDFKHEFTRGLFLRGMFNAEFKKQENAEAMVDPPAPFGNRTNPARNSYLDTMGVRRYYRNYNVDASAYRGRLELVAKFSALGAGHQMIFGGSLYSENLDTLLLRTTTSSSATGFPYADIITHVPGPTLPGLVSLNQNRDAREELVSRSVYVNDLISIVPDRLIMQAGVRHITVNEKRIDHIPTHTDADSNYDEDQDKVTYSLGAVWHLTKNKAWTLYANHCSTFQPNFGEMDYADDEAKAALLPPMTARQSEGGIKYVWQDKLSMLVCYYDILQKNTPEAYVDPYTSESRKRVIAGLHSRGVEVNFNYRPSSEWSLFGGYAYTDCVNESTGARHYRTPRHAVSLFSNYKLGGPLSGLSLNVGVIWRGDSDTLFSEAADGSVREEPIWATPDFLQIDIGASYALKIGKMRWTAAVKLRNAADRLNYITTTNVSARLTLPRTWTFSLATRF
ncbi:MAG: TonB-dependent receptor, partial [Opitutaceae bacterium]|jgi:outer membrane receptor for ferric coprogen and ferric-rhodotorulic acid|nr:TonB-dependent receptor [Opitutaceae bacterium]